MKFGGLLPLPARQLLIRASTPRLGESDKQRELRIQKAINKVKREFPDHFRNEWEKPAFRIKPKVLP